MKMITNLDQYQDAAAKTAIYPDETALAYLATGLAGEAGEVAGKIAKFFRGDGMLDEDAVIKELGDVLWFVSELSRAMEVPLSTVAHVNIRKLQKRQAEGLLKGDGDNR